MKSQKNLWAYDLGSKNFICVTWVPKMYQAMSPEPWPQFPLTGFHFIQDCKLNQIKKNKILENFLTLDSGAQKLDLSHLGPKVLSSHKSRTLAWIFTKVTSFYLDW